MNNSIKYIKILLIALFLILFISLIFGGLVEIVPPPPIQLEKNGFTKMNELKIESLRKMPDNSFCHDSFVEIKYCIDDDFKQKRLGKNHDENVQWSKNLYSNLYAVYSEKFIRQAFYVFRGAEWEIDKIKFIRDKYLSIQKEGKQAGVLETNSDIDKKFKEIADVFSKYDSVMSFVNSCNAAANSEKNLNLPFPIDISKDLISRSFAFLLNNTKDEFLKNCGRLEKKLMEVPQLMFLAHVKFLDNKINEYNGRYISCESQIEYSKNVYQPLMKDIETIYQDDIYNENSSSTEYNRLYERIKIQNAEAYRHFNKKKFEF